MNRKKRWFQTFHKALWKPSKSFLKASKKRSGVKTFEPKRSYWEKLENVLNRRNWIIGFNFSFVSNTFSNQFPNLRHCRMLFVYVLVYSRLQKILPFSISILINQKRKKKKYKNADNSKKPSGHIAEKTIAPIFYGVNRINP